MPRGRAVGVKQPQFNAQGERIRAKPGPKPGTEAAKRGGRAIAALYGSAYFSRIGEMGGTTVKDRHGVAHYAAIGRVGGETTKARHGSEHYSAIGRKGGRVTGAASRKRKAERTAKAKAAHAT
jgi:general stress protein YciG